MAEDVSTRPCISSFQASSSGGLRVVLVEPTRSGPPPDIGQLTLDVDSGSFRETSFATSASGKIRCEIQDAEGKPIPGFTLADCAEIGGDEIDRTVHWKGGSDVSALAGKPVRLRFVLKDADVFAFQFRK